MKGVQFVVGRYIKRARFCQKWYVNKKGKGLDLRLEPSQVGLEFSFPLIINYFEIQLIGVQVKGVTFCLNVFSGYALARQVYLRHLKYLSATFHVKSFRLH